MSKRLVDDVDDIQYYLEHDSAFTENVYRDEKGVYILNTDDSKRYITELAMETEVTEDER